MQIDHLNTQKPDEYWMQKALLLAEKAEKNGEVPVGAVLISAKGDIIGSGCNSPILKNDPTAHAEIIAIREACSILENYRLPETSLYVTLEPCIMCMGAIIHTRIKRLVFGAFDPKTGSAGSVYNIGEDRKLNHELEITGGILQEDCSLMLKYFFKKRRKKKQN